MGVRSFVRGRTSTGNGVVIGTAVADASDAGGLRIFPRFACEGLVRLAGGAEAAPVARSMRTSNSACRGRTSDLATAIRAVTKSDVDALPVLGISLDRSRVFGHRRRDHEPRATLPHRYYARRGRRSSRRALLSGIDVDAGDHPPAGVDSMWSASDQRSTRSRLLVRIRVQPRVLVHWGQAPADTVDVPRPLPEHGRFTGTAGLCCGRGRVHLWPR